MSSDCDWFVLHDVEDYYHYDIYPYSTPIKVNGLSGLEAVNSFSAVSYTKVSICHMYMVKLLLIIIH